MPYPQQCQKKKEAITPEYKLHFFVLSICSIYSTDNIFISIYSFSPFNTTMCQSKQDVHLHV